jgi:hypothetical protein
MCERRLVRPDFTLLLSRESKRVDVPHTSAAMTLRRRASCLRAFPTSASSGPNIGCQVPSSRIDATSSSRAFATSAKTRPPEPFRWTCRASRAQIASRILFGFDWRAVFLAGNWIGVDRVPALLI